MACRYPQAVDGNKPNNNLFSQCSRDSISQSFLDKRVKCFKEQTEVCGKGIVETDQECDCGDDCANSCTVLVFRQDFR
jgi:hypothetical protein